MIACVNFGAARPRACSEGSEAEFKQEGYITLEFKEGGTLTNYTAVQFWMNHHGPEASRNRENPLTHTHNEDI